MVPYNEIINHQQNILWLETTHHDSNYKSGVILQIDSFYDF
jgi:hypothetical protein